jgi:hypothetical protein
MVETKSSYYQMWGKKNSLMGQWYERTRHQQSVFQVFRNRCFKVLRGETLVKKNAMVLGQSCLIVQSCECDYKK